jgi:hypothetical protein
VQIKHHDSERKLTLTITVVPIDTVGHFAAYLGDVPLGPNTRTPLCDAARVLLGRGFDPAARLTMRHRDSGVDALRVRLAVAAKLTVKERPFGPVFERWEPFSTPPVAAPIAPTANSDLPGRAMTKSWREVLQVHPAADLLRRFLFERNSFAPESRG